METAEPQINKSILDLKTKQANAIGLTSYFSSNNHFEQYPVILNLVSESLIQGQWHWYFNRYKQ